VSHGASQTTNTGGKQLPPTVATNGSNQVLPLFDPQNPKGSCEPVYRSLIKLEGEKFALACWKHTSEAWELRFDTIRDVVQAVTAIRKVLGDKPGSELIGSIMNGFTMDAEGLQQIRQELVRASLGEVTPTNGEV
jgi:hypothetical protein